MTRLVNRAHLARIKAMSCVLCGAPGPSDAHHIREGQGMGQRADDVLAVPLCKMCHQGPFGIHGDRTLLRIYKMDEMDLLARTLTQILA